jgi:hypothetical protein
MPAFSDVILRLVLLFVGLTIGNGLDVAFLGDTKQVMDRGITQAITLVGAYVALTWRKA